MKIGIACGGTGGHIFPGLATAEALRRRGHAVILWLAGKDVEQAAVAGWEGPIEIVRVSGLVSLFSFRNVGILWQLWQGCRQCRAAMQRHQPDVLLAMGSYASVAPVWAARRLGIPVVLHEANVIPGRAIRVLSRWATAVAIGFDETRQYLKHRRLVVTGMPLWKRSEPLAVSNEQWRGLQPNRFTVLIMGGSRGAHSLNEKAVGAIIRLHQAGKPVQAIHLTGLADESGIRRKYEQAGVAHAVFGFLHDMAQAYQRASLAISRSGASTCAELCCYGIPALLVPYPFATHQHQLANARALAATGAAEVRVESELTVEGLADYIAAALAEPDRLARMRQAARARHKGDAADSLADLVEQVFFREEPGKKYAYGVCL